MTVLVHRTMSLDGYIAGPEHEMDWIFEHDPPDDMQEIIAATGAIVVGRGSWQVGARDTGKPYGAPLGLPVSRAPTCHEPRPMTIAPVAAMICCRSSGGSCSKIQSISCSGPAM